MARRSRRPRARAARAGAACEQTDVALWQEDESPFERVAQGLKDRGIATGRLGVEETVKFVFADSVASAAPSLHVTSATPITAGCRMIKDSHELELIDTACHATLKCYEAVFHALSEGMTQNTVSGLIAAAYGKLGFPGFASIQVGEYTALPHGSITPQTIREGTIIMIDDGCTVGGLSVRHHAHVRARQGHRQDEEGVRHRAPGAERRAEGGDARARRSSRSMRPRAK